MIGERTAEEVKIQIGTALPLERELTDGGPRPRPDRRPAAHHPDHLQSEVMEAIEPPLQQLVAAVRSVLEQTPPELSSDIIDKGMVMSGGGALLRNVDKLLTQVTGVPATSPRTRSTASRSARASRSSTSTSSRSPWSSRSDRGPGPIGRRTARDGAFGEPRHRRTTRARR